MFIKELDINKQNKIIKILTKFVGHFKTRNLYRYDNNQFCEQCSKDKEHFKNL